MSIRNVWIVLATWGLAGAALAQTETPPATNTGAAQPAPQTSGPAAARTPHQSESPPNQNPNPSGASSPHQRGVTRLAEAGPGGTVSSGMMVQDRAGQTLGTVGNVLKDKSGQRYVFVSGSDGRMTPLPYAVASSTLAAGKVVLDRSAFEQAPKIKHSDMSKGRWRTKVDQYWRKQTR